MSMWDKERINAIEEIMHKLEERSRGRTGSNDALIIPIDALRQVLDDTYKQYQNEKHGIVSIANRLQQALGDLHAVLQERLIK